MDDIRSVGEDLLGALQAEAANDNAGGEALRAVRDRMEWRLLDPDVRDVFQRAALRFLSE